MLIENMTKGKERKTGRYGKDDFIYVSFFKDFFWNINLKLCIRDDSISYVMFWEKFHQKNLYIIYGNICNTFIIL